MLHSDEKIFKLQPVIQKKFTIKKKAYNKKNMFLIIILLQILWIQDLGMLAQLNGPSPIQGKAPTPSAQGKNFYDTLASCRPESLQKIKYGLGLSLKNLIKTGKQVRSQNSVPKIYFLLPGYIEIPRIKQKKAYMTVSFLKNQQENCIFLFISLLQEI